MDGWFRAFLIILGGLALFAQPGPYINDEVGQLGALTSLADGSLLVTSDMPPGYDPIRNWHWGIPPVGAEPRANTGSTMSNVLALPVLGTLRALEVPLGPMGAVGLVSATLIGVGLWAWRGDRWVAAGAGSAVFLGAIAMQVWSTPPASPYLEAGALQLVDMTFHAFASALLYDLLRNRVSRPGLATALYAFGTPAMFWGLNLKYHAIAISCAMICIWLYQEGHRTGPLRTALAFAVAGLAVWNHLPNGLLVTASLGLMAVPAVMLGAWPLVKRAGAGIAGFAVGVVPEVWDRMAHNALEVRDRFIQIGGTGAGGAGGTVEQVEKQITAQSERGRLQWAAWNDPEGPFDAFWQMSVWPDHATPHIGHAMPILALLPVVVLIAWAYRKPLRDKWGWPLLAWPGIHLLVLLVLFGRGVFLNGDAFDLRQASTLWPFLALPVAAVVGNAAIKGRDIAKAGGILVAAMAVLVWAPFYFARTIKGYSALERGPTFDLVLPLIHIGVAFAIALLVVWLVPRLEPYRNRALAAAVAWSFMVQGLLQLGPARNAGPGVDFPFLAWPMAGLEWLVHRYIYPM